MTLRHIPSEHAADVEFLRHCEGLHVASLDEGEMAAFERLCAAGLACAEAETGFHAMLGFSKVRLG